MVQTLTYRRATPMVQMELFASSLAAAETSARRQVARIICDERILSFMLKFAAPTIEIISCIRFKQYGIYLL